MIYRMFFPALFFVRTSLYNKASKNLKI